jgi:hypothetical protein
MANTAQHLKARGDQDLAARFHAAAEQLGIEDAAGWAYARMGKLVTQVVSGDQTIADVYAYADETRKAYIAATPDPPGANLGSVTDAFLTTAIQAVVASEA